MTILPIIRTNNQRSQTLELIEKVRDISSVAPTIVGDDRETALNFKGLDFISLNKAHISSWGFTNLPPKWGWFCGDFCYYAALEAFPDHQNYLLIEDDVYLSELALETLLNRIANHSGFDASAAYLSADYSTAPKYSANLAAFGRPANVGCIFPMTVSSPRHIQAMKTLRTALLARKIQVNDEAVFASATLSGDFDSVPLETLLQDQINKDCFSTNPPKLLETVSSMVADRQIWHPVVSYQDILQRISSGEKNYTRHRLRKVLKSAPGPIKKSIKAALTKKEAASSV